MTLNRLRIELADDWQVSPSMRSDFDDYVAATDDLEQRIADRDQRAITLAEEIHAALQTFAPTLNALKQEGEAMTEELRGMLWRRHAIMGRMTADLQGIVANYEAEYEQAIATISEILAEQGVTAMSFPGGTSNPQAATAQLRKHCEKEDLVLQAKGRLNHALGALRSYTAAANVAPQEAEAKIKPPELPAGVAGQIVAELALR
jgi:hypothetical protein